MTSRLIIDATIPWEWRDKFPEVVELSKEERAATIAKRGDVLFGAASNRLVGSGV